MGWICPRCKRPEAVSHVENGDGLHTFPCLYCDFSTLTGPPLSAMYGSAACAVPRCQGQVTDAFQYDGGMRLVEVRRQLCPACGTREAAEVSNAPHRSAHH
ncbi:hypothetical protein ACFVIM_31020 [Streptomyces sp. NPDC057638]|uniref:hypothetical protein n=1 Tax=Streptomyces sp. NPDC057638 TaxID=3346190 RepID=UPI0036B600B2